MTPLARARLVGIFGVFGGALAALVPACGLDWTVREDPGDGPVPESSRPDVTVVEGGRDGPLDAPDGADGAPDKCVTLGASVKTAKFRAKECTVGASGQCATTVQDECECPVVVKLPGANARNTAYADAIAALNAQCAAQVQAGCLPCPGLPAMASWACLVRPADAGGGVECYPF